MILQVFSVFDSKAKVYSQPFYSINAGVAVRSFTDLVNDPGSSVHRYPEDFTLFQIATFDDARGVVVPLPEHFNLGLAAAFKGVRNENAS